MFDDINRFKVNNREPINIDMEKTDKTTIPEGYFNYSMRPNDDYLPTGTTNLSRLLDLTCVAYMDGKVVDLPKPDPDTVYDMTTDCADDLGLNLGVEDNYMRLKAYKGIKKSGETVRAIHLPRGILGSCDVKPPPSK